MFALLCIERRFRSLLSVSPFSGDCGLLDLLDLSSVWVGLREMCAVARCGQDALLDFQKRSFENTFVIKLFCIL